MPSGMGKDVLMEQIQLDENTVYAGRPTTQERSASANVYSLYTAIEPYGLRRVISEYGGLLSLPRGWDGHGGRPIAVDTFLFGIDMLRRTLREEGPVPPQIVPLSYGGIQIEWHSTRGDLEVEIAKPYQFSGEFEDLATREVTEFSGRSDFSQISELIKRL